jgi:hypothetical protein
MPTCYLSGEPGMCLCPKYLALLISASLGVSAWRLRGLQHQPSPTSTGSSNGSPMPLLGAASHSRPKGAAPALGVPHDLSLAWPGLQIHHTSSATKGTSSGGPGPRPQPDHTFLWLPCIHSHLPLPPLSCSLACLPAMPLFALDTDPNSRLYSPCPHGLQGLWKHSH